MSDLFFCFEVADRTPESISDVYTALDQGQALGGDERRSELQACSDSHRQWRAVWQQARHVDEVLLCYRVSLCRSLACAGKPRMQL